MICAVSVGYDLHVYSQQQPSLIARKMVLAPIFIKANTAAFDLIARCHWTPSHQMKRFRKSRPQNRQSRQHCMLKYSQRVMTLKCQFPFQRISQELIKSFSQNYYLQNGHLFRIGNII